MHMHDRIHVWDDVFISTKIINSSECRIENKNI